MLELLESVAAEHEAEYYKARIGVRFHGPRTRRETKYPWFCPHCRLDDLLIGFKTRQGMWLHIYKIHNPLAK